MSCGSLNGRGVWGRVDTCVCMTVSLLYTWNYHNVVNWLYSSIKQKVKKKQPQIHSDVKKWLIDGEEETNPNAEIFQKIVQIFCFHKPPGLKYGLCTGSMESRETNFMLEKCGKHDLSTRWKPASVVIGHADGIYPCCDETGPSFCDLPPWNT